MQYSLQLILAIFIASSIGCSQDKSDEVFAHNSTDQAEIVKVPPFNPGSDEIIVEDVKLVARCHNEVSVLFPNSEIKNEVVTENNEKFRVWRADIFSLVCNCMGRLVCWKPNWPQNENVLVNSKFLDDSDKPLPKE